MSTSRHSHPNCLGVNSTYEIAKLADEESMYLTAPAKAIGYGCRCEIVATPLVVFIDALWPEELKVWQQLKDGGSERACKPSNLVVRQLTSDRAVGQC